MRFAGDDSDELLLDYLLSEANIPNPNDIAGNFNWQQPRPTGLRTLTKEQLMNLPNGNVGLPKYEKLRNDINLPPFLLKKAELEGQEVAGLNLGQWLLGRDLLNPQPFADGTFYDTKGSDGRDPTMWTKRVRKSPGDGAGVSYPDESFQNDDLVPWIWH